MSDPFDDGLASALKSAVPELPGEFDPLEIIGASRPPRARGWVAPVAVAALVIGVAVGVVVARGGSDRGPQDTVGQRASQIYGSWVLTDLRGMNNAPHIRPHFTGAFGFAADGTAHGGCVATQSTITSASITFDHGWPDLDVADGCRRLPPAQSRFVFGRVLHGRTAWRISGGVLTIGAANASIVLTRPQDLDNGQVRARLYQLAVDAVRQQGAQIDVASAAFAETRSAASSALHRVPSPYVAPMWVLQIHTAKSFTCGGCNQFPGRRPERFRYLYLYTDLHARHSAPAGYSTHAADLAKLGTVVRLDPTRQRGSSIDRPEPVVSSGRLTAPISFSDGSILLRPPSADDTPAISADAALAAFKATGFTVDDDNAQPITFLAALTDFHNSTETTPAGRPAPTSTNRLIWVIEYPDVPSMPSGGGAYPQGSPAPRPPKPALEDVLGITDAQTGKLDAIITTLPDPTVTDLSRAPIATDGKPSPAAS